MYNHKRDRSLDATWRYQSQPPPSDPDAHTRKRFRPNTTYFQQAQDFSIYGAEFNHVEGDQYISHYKSKDSSILLVNFFCGEIKITKLWIPVSHRQFKQTCPTLPMHALILTWGLDYLESSVPRIQE